MTDNCAAYETGTKTHYTSWAEAPTTDPARPDCEPTCWELIDGSVDCMEQTVAQAPVQELAHTGIEHVDPMTAIAGAIMLVVGIALVRTRKEN